MYGRNRAEREWMADVAAQMIRDELLDDDDYQEFGKSEPPKQLTCISCGGTGVVTIGDEDESEDFTCDDCSGTGLVDEDD